MEQLAEWQSHTVVEAKSPSCSDLDIVQALVLSQAFTVLCPKPKDVKWPDEESKCKQNFIKDWVAKEIFLLDEEGRKVSPWNMKVILNMIWNASDCNTKILCMRGFICLTPLLVTFFSLKNSFHMGTTVFLLLFTCICLYLFSSHVFSETPSAFSLSYCRKLETFCSPVATSGG